MDADGISELKATLFTRPYVKELSSSWTEAYERRKRSQQITALCVAL